MIGKQLPKQRITPAEAVNLAAFGGTEEIERVLALYNAHRDAQEFHNAVFWDMLDLWDLANLLSFIYDTGRIQGIREERAKQK